MHYGLLALALGVLIGFACSEGSASTIGIEPVTRIVKELPPPPPPLAATTYKLSGKGADVLLTAEPAAYDDAVAECEVIFGELRPRLHAITEGTTAGDTITIMAKKLLNGPSGHWEIEGEFKVYQMPLESIAEFFQRVDDVFLLLVSRKWKIT